MPVWRMQVALGADSALPRDRLVITPHFNDGGALTDADGLCEDLADAMSSVFGTREVEVKAYDAQGTQPVYPQGQAIRNAGVYPESGVPREIALCLSFYANRNIPRQRGRVFVPVCALDSQQGGVRPGPVMRNQVAELAPIFEQLGGPDVDWCVYSRTDNVARSVTNWFVDDEWDTIRSRGLRATTRDTGTTSEG